MSTKTMSAAIAAIMAVSMPMAFAAEPAAPPATNGSAAPVTQPAPPAGKTAKAEPTQVKPGEMRFSEMNGETVYGRDNKDIGKIDEVVLDPNGKVAAVAIKHGGFLGLGGKDIAVAMNQLKVSTDKDGKPRFTLDMTENQLKSAQAYELDRSKTNTATGSSTPPAQPAPARR